MDTNKFNEQAAPHVHDDYPKFYTTTVPVTVPLPNVPTTPLAPAPKPVLRKRPWYHVERPHPLLWVALAFSTLAILLGVPKGTFPTVTGRHKELRTQELLVQERLALITQLSAFLPPPLSALFAIPDATPSGLDMVRLSRGMQLWHTQGRDGTWWNLEDLGAGAQVVRAQGERDREVWVLRTGEGDTPLLAALTNSLLARERLYVELDAARSQPCQPTITATVPAGKDKDEKWDRWDEEQRRLRQRTDELEEREQDVIRREMWVVDAMRKLSDKSHNSASQLDMEDRVVERLKAYQRQIKTEL
ncbi:hypothetical protein CcaverHIS002_0104180 [Cutaneotrichosporon cavernicola]|uniref:Uncharacterized protein n=1 Tax=Cutaneotrichosporon cavernicola TaxID=279322 RepID=A0AA48IHW2_9TREE|nr:uncharacterized protein CcaverHIS019_0104110 [Cutaneotrichosporon cavernicola]BEI79889.1 hypothetical protein CcaverHIS002_0104180 [Cutaneotrichosporon cavernicola]BEI87693.1 hypothetical protein CcaverHIS019_0104110 [Cutaneotrichosporon cavernicola]BEI95465.1 hypothetical protein CcaverHIS631_0104140 [Cutaneotrichosporon cavernicola]BEJ03239.1 hypothetical protein CcaverHIS641_0104140 [Cutaneotrichosporon cavernicola]